MFGDGKIDAASGDLLGEAVVVARGIVAEEAEVEAVFAGGGAVAAAAVAARAEEDRHHVEAEAEGARRRWNYWLLLGGGDGQQGKKEQWGGLQSARDFSPAATLGGLKSAAG